VHRLNMDCVKVATKNVWGPFSIEDEITVPRLTRAQRKCIWCDFLGLTPIIRLHRKWGGIWAGSTCTRECRHAFFS